MTFSINNISKRNPQKIEKALRKIKATIAAISGTAFISGNVKWAFYAAIAGGVIDFLGDFFADDDPDTNTIKQ